MYQEDEEVTVEEEVEEVRIPSKKVKKPSTGKDITGKHVERMCVICGGKRSWSVLKGEVFSAGNVVATICCAGCKNTITYTASAEDAKVV